MRGPQKNSERAERVCRDSTKLTKVELLYPATGPKGREQKEILQTILDNIPVMIAFLDPQGRHKWVNSAWEKTLGWSLQEAQSHDVLKEFYPDAEYRQYVVGFIAKAESKWGDFRTRRRDGTVLDTCWTNVPLSDGSNIGIGLNITERKKAEQALRESELRYRSIFEQAADSIVVLDAQTEKIAEFNDRAHESLGYTREEFAELMLSDIEAAESEEGTKAHINKVVRRGSDTFETRQRKKDGTICDVLVSAKPITIAGRQYIQGVWRDITERKKAEEEMLQLDRVMETIADVNQLIFRIQDRDELLRKICEVIVSYAYRMVWIGFCDGKDKLIVPQAQAGFEEGCLKSVKITFDDSEYGTGPSGLAVKTARPDVMRFIATDQRYEPWREEATKYGCRSLAAIPILKGNKAIGVLNVYADTEDAFGQEEVKLLKELANDISTGLRGIDEHTRRRHAEQKLLEYQKQLKQLAARLTLTEERQRRHIAGELHDQINQSLALAKMKLDTLRATPMSKPAEEVLAEVGDTLESVIDDTRSLIFNISSPILHELGFEAAVAEWLNEQVRDKHGIAVEFQDDGLAKPLDDDVQVLLFRNVRELFINIIKHASAGKVRVCVRRTDGSIEVTVEDDGIGFAPMEAGAMAAEREEFGLLSIRESLEELGGHFEIESRPGAGCKATMTAPLEDQSRRKEI